MLVDDNFYMSLAISEAWKYQLLTYPNPAVGAVVLKNDELLSIQAHKCAGGAHAEVLALKEAYLKKYPNDLLSKIVDVFELHNYLVSNTKDFFEDCTIYVSLEPCKHLGKTPSCAKLLEKLKIQRLVISCKDDNKKASGGSTILENAGVDVKYFCMEKDGKNLLYPFLQWSKKSFIFFKMAQTLNGTINGGKISGKPTLKYVHSLRSKIDLLCIGGNTVREDKPILDTRYIKDGINPDILIYSKQKSFDTSIELFNVSNRNVYISDNLEKLDDSNFVMIEGGYKLLEIIKTKIDYIILLISPEMKFGLNYISKMNLNFKIIHEYYIEDDKIVFLKLLRHPYSLPKNFKSRII